MRKTLLTATAVLALTLTNANADPTPVTLGTAITIHPQVDLVGSFGLTPVSDLKFGVIVVPNEGTMADKTITVTPSGTAYGNVTLLGGSLTGGTSESPVNAGTTTVAAGRLTVSGQIGTLLDSRGESSQGANDGARVRLVFTDISDAQNPVTGSIKLINGTGQDAVVCGTVTNIQHSGNGYITQAGNYDYGGTLTLTAAAVAGMHCVGNATVTMVFDE